MKLTAFILAACCLAGPGVAETYDFDASTGLAALESELSSTTTPVETAAFGAVQFLRGVERTMQSRYRSNAALGTQWMNVPLLRLPFAPNPDPEPFRPEIIKEIFEDLSNDMATARATLEGVSLGPEDALRIDLAKLWFDVDRNGERDDDEGILRLIAASVLDPRVFEVQGSADGEGLVVRFDAADVEWLLAYTHFLSAISDMVVAFDPTEPIARMIESRDRMASLGQQPATGMLFMSPDDAAFVDAFATIYGALNKVPDQPRLASAREHFLGMVRANRRFWELVNAETDNELEWIPNASQVTALGFDMPPETGEVWLSVLSDAEAVLNGEMLVGHWRLGPGAGVNVAKLVQNPPAVDIVTWFQGQGLSPYMEKGQTVSAENYARFMAMFQGSGLLFMVLLN